MRLLHLSAFLLFLFLGTAFSRVSYGGHKVYRVIPASVAQIRAIEKFSAESNFRLDFWAECYAPGSWCDIHPDLSIDNQFTTFLDANSIKYSVMIEDIDHNIRQENLYEGVTDNWFIAYHDYDSTVTWLRSLVSTYPNLATLKSVGQSYQNRTIWAVEIKSSKASPYATGDTKPAFAFDGGIHAREWISPAVVEYQLYTLLSQYGTDPTVTAMVDNFDWYIVPLFNLDGYYYTWLSDRLWRKTRMPNKGSSCVGTDPCRNAPTGWGGAGSSAAPCDATYRGTAPLDQPEVRQMVQYIGSIPNLKAYINFHSYRQLFMSPWGYTFDLPPAADYEKQMAVANATVAAIQAKHGTVFVAGPVASTIYQASGIMSDHIYAAYGIVYSYSPELRDTGKYGFVLPADQIIPSGEEIFEGMKVMANMILSELSEKAKQPMCSTH